MARCAPESVLVAKWPVSQWGLSSRARKECVAESRGMCPFHPAGLHPTEVQSGTEDPVRPAPDVPGGRGGGQVHSRVPGTCRFLTFTSPLRVHILARVRLWQWFARLPLVEPRPAFRKADSCVPGVLKASSGFIAASGSPECTPYPPPPGFPCPLVRFLKQPSKGESVFFFLDAIGLDGAICLHFLVKSLTL